MQRISKENYYLNIAQTVLERCMLGTASGKLHLRQKAKS